MNIYIRMVIWIYTVADIIFIIDNINSNTAYDRL